MNHLHDQTSPYLLQHRDNPVDWYPWDFQALARAKEQDKPILLSIGYSACHWCHVMAHESFEEAETAAIMNREFINIKVDREERPDIDKIYQTAQQVLNCRSGGWPLTAFLNPDTQIPFFIGTYFPKEARYGLPSFKQLLEEIAVYFRTHRHEIALQNVQIQDALHRLASYDISMEALSGQPLLLAKKELENAYDEQQGGFTGAPKFPQATYIEQLFHYYFLNQSKLSTDDPDTLLKMAVQTLKKMAWGGVYDQLGGGFFRYSVDKYWMIPHFEKMLYDNALLLPVYTYGWKMTEDDLFKQIIEETAAWVLREMQSPEGGYYSSLDADVDSAEGETYLWQPIEIKKLLDREEYKIIEYLFGLDNPPNFEGKWHLYVARELSATKEDPEQIIMSAKTKLLAARQKRKQPACDHKVLTSWNGLMVKAMAIAGKALHRQDYLDSATSALHFIYTTLWKNNRLLATYKDGRAHLNAYLDDYVFVIEGILALLEADWNSQYFNFAVQLAECLLTFFYDPDQGGFYFTSHDHEKLIQRFKPLMDEATPAGNGVAAGVLIRLGHLLGEARYLGAAEATLKMASEVMKSSAYAYGSLLFALEEILSPPEIIILCYRDDDKQEGRLKAWQSLLQQPYHPHRISFSLSEHEPNLHPALSHYRLINNTLTAYVCRGTECSAPITHLQELRSKLLG